MHRGTGDLALMIFSYWISIGLIAIGSVCSLISIWYHHIGWIITCAIITIIPSLYLLTIFILVKLDECRQNREGREKALRYLEQSVRQRKTEIQSQIDARRAVLSQNSLMKPLM
jgi:hypothetical protein